jgi:tRNA(Ile)-lysidine synthase
VKELAIIPKLIVPLSGVWYINFVAKNSMIRKAQSYIEERKLLNNSDKVIVGLSGGADSVVLFHVLYRLGYNCLAAHCNFHLRGEESDRDEQFAAGFAASFNLPFFKQDFDTRNVAKERGVSIEMAARDLRYQWFAELREKHQADAIAVAHHRDDSIETLLLNLIRGTGIKGLTGIQPRTGNIVRPLLCVSKQEILQYAETENLPFIIDSTNEQAEWTRNKIRLQVIPLLETINPSVRESIIQTMDNLNETLKVYETEIGNAIRAVYDRDKGSISIPLLKTFPSPESVLFELLKSYGFGKDVIREIYCAMDSQPGKTFYASGYCVVKDRDAFLLTPFLQQDKKEYLIQPDETKREHPLRMEISTQINDARAGIDKHTHIASLDLDKLEFPLTLRKWKAGDRFVPLGMKSFQKLSDFFTNRKFSKIQKDETWILTSGKNVVWVVNHRIDERFKVSNSTKKRYIIKLL